MQQNYSKKTDPIQKASKNTASSVLDASSQSEALQRKADMANNAAQREEAPRPNNTGMPDNLKSGIESLSGFSMDDVRVHYNSSKPATVQALAYTQGTDIHVAPGQEKHLPHEAWHVAQQMAGRVSPTTNINGMPVNDNAALEQEADVMGEKAVQCRGWNDVIEKKYDSKTAQCYTAVIPYRGTLYPHPFNTLGELVSCIRLNPNIDFEDSSKADMILRELEKYENYENLIITKYHSFFDIIKDGLQPFLKTTPLNAEVEDEEIYYSIGTPANEGIRKNNYIKKFEEMAQNREITRSALMHRDGISYNVPGEKFKGKCHIQGKEVKVYYDAYIGNSSCLRVRYTIDGSTLNCQNQVINEHRGK